MSLRVRLLLLTLFSIIVAILINITFVTKEYREHFENLLLERGEIAALELSSQVNRLLDLGIYIDEFSGFEKQLNEIVSNNQSIKYIAITHLYGKLLYESTINESYDKLAKKNLENDSNNPLPIELLHITRAVGEPPVANILVILDSEVIEFEVSKLGSSILIYNFISIIIGITLLFFLLWYQFNKPVNALLKSISEASLERISTASSILVTRKDEIGVIAKTFESLIKKLARSQYSLRSLNEDLEEHKRNLEEQVKQRTMQIATINKKLLNDIERRKTLEAKLEKMAHTDSLTDLPNRRILEQYIEKEIIRSTKEKSKFAFLYFDIDDFKKVNDEFSHDTGDAALKNFADSLKKSQRSNEYFARLGGDEFCLIVTDYNDRSQIEKVASQLIKENAPGVSVSGIKLGLSLSIGIAIFPDNGNSFRELRTESDLAMFNVKKHLKGNYAFA